MTSRRVGLSGILAWLLPSAPAHADWAAGAYLGSAWTSPARLTLDRGAAGSSTFEDMPLDSRSFESPPYYGYRLTTAAPAVSVAGGTIQGRYLSQHLAAGLGVAW
jgi:hypothetical protein